MIFFSDHETGMPTGEMSIKTLSQSVYLNVRSRHKLGGTDHVPFSGTTYVKGEKGVRLKGFAVTWLCTRCGYEHEALEPLEDCPVCERMSRSKTLRS